MAVAAPYLIIAAAVYSAASAYSQGQQQKKLAEYNASVAEGEAKAARAWGEYNAARQDGKNQILAAKQRNALNQSGVDVSSGSPLAVLADTWAQNELEKAAIRYNAANRATQLENQALGSRYQGRIAAQAGLQRAGGALLQGASQMSTLSAAGKLDWGFGSETTGSLGDYNGGFTRNIGGIDAQ